MNETLIHQRRGRFAGRLIRTGAATCLLATGFIWAACGDDDDDAEGTITSVATGAAGTITSVTGDDETGTPGTGTTTTGTRTTTPGGSGTTSPGGTRTTGPGGTGTTSPGGSGTTTPGGTGTAGAGGDDQAIEDLRTEFEDEDWFDNVEDMEVESNALVVTYDNQGQGGDTDMLEACSTVANAAFETGSGLPATLDEVRFETSDGQELAMGERGTAGEEVECEAATP